MYLYDFGCVIVANNNMEVVRVIQVYRFLNTHDRFNDRDHMKFEDFTRICLSLNELNIPMDMSAVNE